MAVPLSLYTVPNATTEDTNPSYFFNLAYQTFEATTRYGAEVVDRFYEVGGNTIRLRFAGPSLIPLITPALEHLAVPPAPESALTICLWDSASTGSIMPNPPWSSTDYIARTEVKGYNDEFFRTAFNQDSGVFSMLDYSQDLAIFWISDANNLPFYESGAPLLSILQWWMQRNGRQVVHAAALGTSEGGVLLVGKSGSGKSNTAMAAIGSNLTYVADDYCVLCVEPAPYIHSLYCTGKLNADDIHRFPSLAPALSNRERLNAEKALFFLYRDFHQNISLGFPLRAIIVPHVTDQVETTLTALAPAVTLRALAPSTIFQLPGAGRSTFRMLSRLVRQMPCYQMNLGTSIGAIPEVLLALLASK